MSLKRQRKNETSSEHESTFCSCKSEADDSDPNILVSLFIIRSPYSVGIIHSDLRDYISDTTGRIRRKHAWRLP